MSAANRIYPRLHFAIASLLAATVGVGLLCFQGAPIAKLDAEHNRQKAMIPQRLKDIESTLNALADRDPAAVASVADVFAKVMDDENNRTALLQQRASNLLAAAALAVSIILTSISLMLRDARKYLDAKDVAILPYLLCLTLLFFGIALYWTWQGFTVLPFEGLYVDSLLNNMKQAEADLQTARVAVMRQEYKIIGVNTYLNTVKSLELRWATADFFLGLAVFSAICLLMLIRANRPVEGGTSDAEKGRSSEREETEGAD